MNRYQQKFEALTKSGRGAFVPFTVLGDPDLKSSLTIIETLVEAGADALELGFPFSDPLADGPVIQGAMDRALASGVTTHDCLELIRQFRESDDQTPIGLLVYANVVYAYGVPGFYSACKESGVDSVLVADVPLRECRPFCEAAVAAEIDPILLCPPNIDDDGLTEVAGLSQGYVYLLSRAGVTGTETQANMPLTHLIKKLGEQQSAPPLLGFGISQPEHVSNAIRAGARGVIVGSAIVKLIEQNVGNMEEMQSSLLQYVSSMKSAT